MSRTSPPNPRRRVAIVIALLLAIGIAVPLLTVRSSSHTLPGTYDSLLNDISAHRISSAQLNTQTQTMTLTLKDGLAYSTVVPDSAQGQLLGQLGRAGARESVTRGSGGRSALLNFLLGFALPMLGFVALFVWIRRWARRGPGGLASYGQAKARRVEPSPTLDRVTFADVAGADEAVEELREIKDCLADPRRFAAIGARIPKGVLLYGPPGTGKTLLARAVAGEAGVPFFSISGSDFVEMFVGVGASRVRNLFQQARESAPCIVFVDEIDAVGRHRGAGMGGGNDEREQTLNQLLVEMDGFAATSGVILIAATNRPDVLDPALLRPGRFDRQIAVTLPDRAGRREILGVHGRGKPLGRKLDLDALAGQTPGFSGADLANVINEAALLAARRRASTICQRDLDEATMRVIAGPEKKTRAMSEAERRITAYHEMGHALVGHYLPHSDPIHKISIISRGQALGYTISLPGEDKLLTTRAELMDTMAMTLGGRTAEEIVFGEITTGASNDLEKVTATAKQMVMRFGMSDKLGPRVFGRDHGQPFLGREFSAELDYSDQIAQVIDDEIRRIVENAHTQANDILTAHRDSLERLSEILIRRETIDRDQFEALADGRTEEQVFGPAPGGEQFPLAPAPASRPRRKRPRALPRPSFADGTAALLGAVPPLPTQAPVRPADGTAPGT